MTTLDHERQDIVDMLGERCAELTKTFNEHIGDIAECVGVHVEFEEDAAITRDFKIILSFRMGN